MFELDEISNLLRVDTDFTVAEIEKRLNPLGYTLGYFCPPDNKILLEEALSRNLPNAYGLLYGSIKERCVALEMEDTRETVIQTKIVPRQATGPHWKNLVLGTGRKLGLIFRAVLKIFPSPPGLNHSVVSLSSWEDSYRLEQELTRHEMIPRAFGRFSKSQIKPEVKHMDGDFFLLLEWVGREAFVKALGHEWERLMRKKKLLFDSHEKPDQKLRVTKLLRQHPPEIPWGGPRSAEKNNKVSDLERQILEVLG